MDETVLSKKIIQRDVEMVNFLSNGKSMKEISEAIGKNQNTVEMRLYRLKKNLGLKSYAHLVAFFLRNKIIE